MISYMDYTSPNTLFAYDLSNNLLIKKDNRNYINELSIKQLNTLGNTSLLDIYLSAGNVVEPHYHQNASELVYCITGAAVVSLINPFTKELLHFPISPGQVANVPQGWWHYEIASVDSTHLLAIFDAPTPEVILGSDILRLTPPSILAHTYCLNEAKVKDTLAPIQMSMFIGPPSDCKPVQTQSQAANKPIPNQSFPVPSAPNQSYPIPSYPNQPYPNQQPNQANPNPAYNRQSYNPNPRQQSYSSPQTQRQRSYPQL